MKIPLINELKPLNLLFPGRYLMIQRHDNQYMAMNLPEIFIITSGSYQPNKIEVTKWKHVTDSELNQVLIV